MSCRICEHPARDEIERRLATGESVRKLGVAYAISHSIVQRHRKQCVPNAAVAPEARAAAARILNSVPVPAAALPPRLPDDAGPIERIKWIYASTTAVLERCTARGDDKLALSALAHLRSQVELLARLFGEITVQHRHEVVGPGGGPVQVAALVQQLPPVVQQLAQRAEAGDWKAQRQLDRYSLTETLDPREQAAIFRRLLAEAEAEAQLVLDVAPEGVAS